jgi:hypothetical protein
MTALQPIDWWAETMTAVEPQYMPMRSRTRLYEVMPMPEAAELLGDGHAEHAHREELVDDPAGDLLLLVDLATGVLVRR